MSGPEFHAGLSGHNIIAAPQASHGGVINVTYAYPAPTIASAPARPFSTVPFPQDPDFVQRPAITAWLRDTLQQPPHRRAALVGLGGIGKSQLAISYAHAVRTVAPDTYIFWVHAGTAQRFEDAYRTIAERLRLPGCRDADADVLRLVRDWLCDEANGRWLMVLDNADNSRVFFEKRADKQESLAGYLPQAEHGSILVTSRSRDAAARLAGSNNSVWAVAAMDEAEALQLLRCKLGDQGDGPMATKLIRVLDRVPLAITQAAAYIVQRAPRMSLATYLKTIQRNKKKKAGLLRKDMGDMRRDVTAHNSIIATWQMTFDAIREERASATDLLALISFFSPQGIPDWILRRSVQEERCPPPTGESESGTADRSSGSEDINSEDIDSSSDGGGDSGSSSSGNNDAFEEDLHILIQYSLVATTLDEGVLEIYPIVQFCTQEWLSSAGRAPTTKRAFFRLMSREYPMGTYENWATCRALDPHIRPFEEGEPGDEEEGEDMAAVLTCAGCYRSTVGSYTAAEGMLRKAVRLREKILGVENPDTLASISILGLVLQDQGKYSEAEAMHRRALEGREKALGIDYPDTLTSVGDLGAVLRHQGKYGEAEVMYRWALEGSEKALEGSEKALGAEHPLTLTSVNNLGSILYYQGKYNEAEELHRRALEGLEKALGAEHPDTLKSVNNLGALLQFQGKYDEAEAMHGRALEGREKALGIAYPDTLTSVSSLGGALQAQGQHNEAEAMHRRALEGYEKALGAEHLLTLSSVGNLGAVLHQQGKYDEAEAMHRRALEGYEKALGIAHPDTLVSTWWLARLLHSQSNFQGSKRLYDRAWEGYKATLGPHHPHTVACGRHRSLLIHKMEGRPVSKGL